MGYKLKQMLSSDWTDEEMNYYNLKRKKELTSFYLMRNAPKSNPRMRAEILDEIFKIEDDSFLEKYVLDVGEKEGKVNALLYLEGLAIRKF